MSEQTKACNLTKEEIVILIKRHGFNMSTNGTNMQSSHIERINYLNKRLEAFKEVELTSSNEAAQAITSTAGAAGWGTSNE